MSLLDSLDIPPDLSGGQKNAFVVDGRRKIHTVWEDRGGIEMAEEYDLASDELLVRKFKKPTTLGGEGEWVYEIGEPPVKHGGDLLIAESSSAPYLFRQDEKLNFVFKIRNLYYPLSVYSVTVDGQQLVVRTSNKKYFKRISIPDMNRAKLPLIQSSVSFTHTGSTLVIRYKKPSPILETEAKAREERKKLKSERPPKDGDVECNSQ
ncbi:putative protein DPCD [Monocercomonoides exilis]|uniref:putative protein DPCD n=1 Tax=Monocercomonoides exilis TaxID=2049356 RepID=UPI003559AC04|nr:putative protein DPCD [Monocercomonoides exilis]|eukprot:MONOS_12040.1-p1 / transcript=MONOS_12040.1 / gene=MONOS_12040 / organism=Monocercomonoides_exilis_PA203 / gene_product=protein DPCD / transcript_product=protein DPCD / location=Mono_scaffold00638:36431-37354(+) / protein_length=206 / sequence_SO=supercontig / SO=protein_coding / is_pseudo=false